MCGPLPAQEIHLDAGGDDRALALAASGDRILIGGLTDADTQDRSSGVYYLLDGVGELVSSHRLDTDNRSLVFDAVPTDDGFLLNCWVNSYRTIDDDVYYAVDMNGDVLFGNRYGTTEGDDQVRAMTPLPGGRVLTLGNSGNDSRAIATVLEADGSVVWRRSLRYPGVSFTVFADAVVGQDGDYYLSGVAVTRNESNYSFMTRITPAGRLVATYLYVSSWEREFGGTRTIHQLPDGNLVLTAPFGDNGSSSNSTGVYTISTQGDLISAVALVSDGPVSVRDALVTPAGTYLLAGTVAAPDRDYGMIIELDASGDIIRQQAVGVRSGSRLSAITPSPEGGYWVAGSIEDCALPFPESDLLLVYLDDNLESEQPCWHDEPPVVKTVRQVLPEKDSDTGRWRKMESPVSDAPMVVATDVATSRYRCPAALASLAPEPLLGCAGDDVEIDVTAFGVDDYTWSDGISGPARSLTAPASVTVVMSSECTSTEVPVIVEAESCCRVYLPTAFTPDGDGVNDEFAPAFASSGCRAVDAYTLRVFDRWGGLVFSSSDVGLGWDGRLRGRLLSGGVYLYSLAYFDGLEEVELTGSVGLMP